MEPVVRVSLEDSIRWDIRPEISVTKFSAVGTVFSVFMEPTGNGFDFFKKKLSSLYVKAESLKELLCEINDTYSLLEIAILSHEESSKGEFL